MKIRQDFVTNSSSSSFVIQKKHLNETQINIIKNLDTMTTKRAKQLQAKLSNMECFSDWWIDENNSCISGSCTMDNFSFSDLFDLIGIPDSVVRWGESLYNNEYDDEEEEYVFDPNDDYE